MVYTYNGSGIVRGVSSSITPTVTVVVSPSTVTPTVTVTPSWDSLDSVWNIDVEVSTASEAFEVEYATVTAAGFYPQEVSSSEFTGFDITMTEVPDYVSNLSDGTNDYPIKAKAVADTNSGYDVKMWTGTKAEFDAIKEVWATPTQQGTDHISGIAYGNGKFVTIGYDKIIRTTTDGVTWSATEPFYGSLYAITFDGTKFVVIFISNSNGYVTTSTDGTTWSEPAYSEGANSHFKSIIYVDGKYVAAGSDGYIYTSTDTLEWTGYNIGSSYAWYGIAYGNGKYTAVGNGGHITTSTDGSTWTTPVQVGPNSWNSIIYANNKFVAVGSNGYITTSTDGSTWTTPVQVGTNSWLSIIYANNKFVAVGANGYITTSTDGSTWTTPIQVGTNNWMGAAYGNDKLVIVGRNGYVSYTYNNTDPNTLYNITDDNTASAYEAYTKSETDSLFTSVDMNNISNDGKKVMDGQWVGVNATLANGVSMTSTDASYDISTYLPNDGYNYEILINGAATTTTTANSAIDFRVYTDLTSPSQIFVCGARTRTTSNVFATGSAIIPVGTGRTITVTGGASWTGTYTLSLVMYRRIGTNI